jgi:hypothetical protein
MAVVAIIAEIRSAPALGIFGIFIMIPLRDCRHLVHGRVANSIN